MKNIKDYIIESFESKNDMRTIVLVKRENIKCSDLSESEFIHMWEEDYNKSIEAANKLLDDEWEDSKEERVKIRKQKAEKYANEKYKQVKRRNAYIEDAVNNEESKQRETYNDIKSFDFDISFGTKNETNTIRHTNIKSQLKAFYDKLTDEKSYANKFWKDAIGWEFKYVCSKKSYMSTERPWINLIVSDEKQKEIQNNEEHLYNNIRNFYSNSNYWGD